MPIRNKKKIWITIDKLKFNNFKKVGIKKLNQKRFKTSPWINDIINKNNYLINEKELPVKLVRIKLKDLKFKGPTQLQKVYKKAKKLNYKLVPPEIALYLRLVYLKQKKGEWVRIATPLNSMIDSDGGPHLPKLGKALGYFFLETYWSYPKAIFHPHNEFIFKL